SRGRDRPMKILSVVGARPQFVKLAAIADAAAQQGDVEHVIVHTGQHYDAAMSDVFFADLRIPAPDVNLSVGSGSHGRQTGAMLAGMDEVLEEHRPDWTLVYGDTNSTLAGTLSAVKMHRRVADLEAGLRSFNRRMPEEHNRVLTDHAADLLLAPTEVARTHLAAEGLAERTLVTGDVMTDVCLRVADSVRGTALRLPGGIDPAQPFAVATIHRADNTDDPDRLRAIIASLQALDIPLALLAHPRLVARAQDAGIPLEGRAVRPSGGRRFRLAPDGGQAAGHTVLNGQHRDRMGRDPRRRLEPAGHRPRHPGRLGDAPHPDRRAAPALRRRQGLPAQRHRP